MIEEKNIDKKNIVLEAIFDSENINKNIIKSKNIITEFLDKNKAFIYLGKKEKLDINLFKKTSNIIVNLKRDYQVDVSTFINKKLSEKIIVREITESYILKHGEVYNLKTSKKPKFKNITLVNLTKNGKNQFNISKNETKVRN
jgi:leucyl aminopeptidase